MLHCNITFTTDEFTLGTLPSSLFHVNLTWHFTQHEYLIFTLLFYFCIWRWQDPMLSGLDGSCQIDDDRKILDRVNLIAQNLFCQIIPIWLDWIIFLNWIKTIKQARIIEPKLTPRRPLNFELTFTLSTFFLIVLILNTAQYDPLSSWYRCVVDTGLPLVKSRCWLSQMSNTP